MSDTDPIVIVGAGHAGTQAAASLREEGFEGGIVLLGDDPHLPYQRPPLSKAFMKREVTREGLALRGAAFYEQRGIDLRRGVHVEAIEREARRLRLRDGAGLSYRHLVLATGARPRPFTLAGADLDGVLALRTLDDAEALRERTERAHHVAVVGAGFIGLEYAAVAAAAGLGVTVVELAARAMGRAVTPIISDFFAAAHRAQGIELLFETGLASIEGADGKVAAVRLADGSTRPADIVLVGIGVLAEDRLARDCGLNCANGIVVDAAMATSDPHVSAIGDCAFHPNEFAGLPIRLESVQNANDQARCLAKRLTGKIAAYADVPWFWSDQGDLKLQMVGFLGDCDRLVTRGSPEERAFSVFGFRHGVLTGVESVNRSGDHMAARRIVGKRVPITPEQAADTAFDLKKLVQAAGR